MERIKIKMGVLDIALTDKTFTMPPPEAIANTQLVYMHFPLATNDNKSGGIPPKIPLYDDD